MPWNNVYAVLYFHWPRVKKTPSSLFDRVSIYEKYKQISKFKLMKWYIIL